MFQAVTTPDGGAGYWKEMIARKRKAREERRLRLQSHKKEKNRHRKNRRKKLKKNTPQLRKLTSLILADLVFSNHHSKRDSLEYEAWRKIVMLRDGFKCVRCGERSGLVAHHIETWVSAPHLRFNASNGVTLCGECHAAQHDWLYDSPEQKHLSAIRAEQ